MLEKTLESHLDGKIKPVSVGNQPWKFIGRTDAKVNLQNFGGSPDVNSWLTGKDHDAGKDWRQEEKGAAEDGVVR